MGQIAEVTSIYPTDVNDMVKPYKGDPFLGNLSTPINDSPLVRAYIRNLPAYHIGLTPFRRGLKKF